MSEHIYFQRTTNEENGKWKASSSTKRQKIKEEVGPERGQQKEIDLQDRFQEYGWEMEVSSKESRMTSGWTEARLEKQDENPTFEEQDTKLNLGFCFVYKSSFKNNSKAAFLKQIKKYH